MRGLLLVAATVAAPASVFADTTPPRYGAVDVEYWGRFIECAYGNCASVPSTLSGRLFIDLGRAPPDRFPKDSGLGVYEVDRAPRGFVTRGLPYLEGGVSSDSVVVDSASILPQFQVTDWEVVLRGNDPVPLAEQQLFLQLEARRNVPWHGDSLVQDFDARPDEMAGEGYGFMSQVLNGVSMGFSFVVDRMRVTPRVCRY